MTRAREFFEFSDTATRAREFSEFSDTATRAREFSEFSDTATRERDLAELGFTRVLQQAAAVALSDGGAPFGCSRPGGEAAMQPAAVFARHLFHAAGLAGNATERHALLQQTLLLPGKVGRLDVPSVARLRRAVGWREVPGAPLRRAGGGHARLGRVFGGGVVGRVAHTVFFPGEMLMPRAEITSSSAAVLARNDCA